jgi:hypothetical protein
MTAADIIKRSLRIAQVISQGDDPSGTDQETDAFTVLNSMIASWSAERLMIPHLVTDTLTLTIGDGEYTFGTGGDINSARPNRIEEAFVRDSQGNDFEVDIIHVSKYNDIGLKTTQGRPYYLYYIAEYPLAKIKLIYVPDAAETLHLDSWKPLSQIAAVGDTISLPGEYQRALEYNLAVNIAPEYAQELPQSVYTLANQTTRTIKNLNAIPVAEVKVDNVLLVGRRNGYNINSDGYR